MRAAFLITDMALGGAPLRTAALVRGLSAKGWDVGVISVMPAGEVLEELTAEGFKTAALGITSPLDLPRGILELRRLVKDWGLQLLQTSLWHANVLGRLASIGLPVSLISTYESVDTRKPRIRTVIDRTTHRLALRHVAVSQDVAQEMARREGIPEAKIDVIPYGLAAEDLEEPGLRSETRAGWTVPDDAQVVGWLGRFVPAKDPILALRSLQYVHEVVLVMGGYGELEREIRYQIQELGLQERVRLPGKISDRARFFEAIDVFSLTSRWEGQGIVVLEAMAAGKPIAACDLSPVREMLADGECGVLARPGDEEAMATAISAALDRPELGDRARARARARFDAQRMVDAYDRLWRLGGDA